MPATSEYPRLLFLTPCAFNSMTGGGVTFSNLFRDWPKDRLATVTDDRVPVDHDVCSNYFFLSDAELAYRRPFCWMKRRTSTQTESTDSAQKRPTGFDQSPSIKSRVVESSRKLIRAMIGESPLPERGKIGQRFRRWIEDFQPDLVYTILGSSGYYDLLENICRDYNLPFVVHIMDHGSIEQTSSGLLGYLQPNLERRLQSLMPRAAVRMAIGSSMAGEYEQRFGCSFLHFQNPIDLGSCAEFRKEDLSCRHPAHLVYIGSIYPFAQLQSLIDCCEAVKSLNRSGFSVRLKIYTPLELFGQHREKLQIDGSIEVCDVPQNDREFFTVLNSADALFLPTNFDSESVNFIRLSMPTKVPPYLAIGTPILAYGPPNVAQIDYATTHGWAYVVGKQDLPMLQDGIRQIIMNQELRSAVSNQAIKTARQFHDMKTVRVQFQQALLHASSIPSSAHANSVDRWAA